HTYPAFCTNLILPQDSLQHSRRSQQLPQTARAITSTKNRCRTYHRPIEDATRTFTRRTARALHTSCTPG
ncbi:hypothetical protein BGZ91_007249, partial [Linnemannia elongata]